MLMLSSKAFADYGDVYSGDQRFHQFVWGTSNTAAGNLKSQNETLPIIVGVGNNADTDGVKEDGAAVNLFGRYNKANTGKTVTIVGTNNTVVSTAATENKALLFLAGNNVNITNPSTQGLYIGNNVSANSSPISIGNNVYSEIGGSSIGYDVQVRSRTAITDGGFLEKDAGFAVGSNITGYGNHLFFGRNLNVTERVADGYTVDNKESVYVGQNITTKGAQHSVLVGYGIKSNDNKGHNSVAFGTNITLGTNNNQTEDLTAIGSHITATAKRAVALGSKVNVSAEDAVAIGTSASAAKRGDVVLGSGSATTTSTNSNLSTWEVAGEDLKKHYDKDNIKQTDGKGVVSVGSDTVKRQIKNVAAGDVTATSTDAVNGAQLYALSTKVNSFKIKAGDAETELTSSTDKPIKFKSENTNLVVSATTTDNTVKFKLGDNLSVTTVKTTGAITATGGVNANGVTIGQNGVAINANNKKISGLADATLSTTSTEAVTGKQLNKTNQDVTAAANKATSALTKAEQASNAASAATNLAQDAKNTASTAKSTAEKASTAASTATAVASEAKTTADQAQTNASAALTKATQLESTLDNQTSYLHVNSTKTGNKGKYNEAAGATGTDSVAIGPDAAASKQSSIAIGDESKAQYEYSIALGTNATASGLNATVIGRNANANGANSDAIVVGTNATSGSTATVVIGKEAKSSGASSISIGQESNSTQAGAVALGYQVSAIGVNATAIGREANASNESATAIGRGANASGSSGTAVGTQANATAGSSAAFGQRANATALASVALGYQAQATGTRAAAVGPDAKAIANFTVAVGNGATASKDQTIAIGHSAQASKENAIALGYNAQATITDGDIALGNGSVTAAQHEATFSLNNKKIGGFVLGSNQGVLSIGSSSINRQIQNVGAGAITATSTDAINGSQLYHVATELNTLASTAQDAATKASEKATALEGRTQLFKVQNGQTEKNTKNGDAKTWTLGQNNEITFGATSDLTVSTDGNGNIIYGLSKTAKDSIDSAAAAAQKVTTKLDEINTQVSTAKSYASSAASSATAASSSAQKASSSAQQASSSANAASSSAKAASSSANAASSSANAASSS
ncbi:hypothetical protein HZI61_09005, partial [Haemophilus influenzae]|nr:hypothetical protein [Haemophilus influenzae]